MTRAKILRRDPELERAIAAELKLAGEQLELPLARLRTTKCEVCGRWNYHLATCTEVDHALDALDRRSR